MNIFYLHDDPVKSAKLHCDKHVVKMVIEYAQLLSTAHRMLRWYRHIKEDSSGVEFRRWRLQALQMEMFYTKHLTSNTQCNMGSRECNSIPILYDMFVALCDEYTYRYGQVHI